MVRQLAASLASIGVDVHVATTNDNGPRLLDVSLGQPVVENGATYWYFARQSRFYTASLPLASWLATHVRNFDVVHIHALFSFASMPASHYAHRDNVPYIVRPLGTLNEWGMTQRRPWLKKASFFLLESRIVKHAALMHYTSDAERDEASRWTNGALSVVIPNAVSDASSEPAAAGAFRARLGLDGNRPIALFLSRLDEKKGLDLLIQAFAQLRQRMPEALLVIAGEGRADFVRTLHSQASALGIPERDIVWTGFLAGEGKRAAFADANVFVLPSYSENFGIAVAEAMAAGLPVVVSNQVAIHHDVAAAGAGRIVACEASAVCGALDAVLRETAVAKQMGQQGRELVRRKYSTAAVTRQVIDVYSQMVGGAARAAARAAQLGTLQGHA